MLGGMFNNRANKWYLKTSQNLGRLAPAFDNVGLSTILKRIKDRIPTISQHITKLSDNIRPDYERVVHPKVLNSPHSIIGDIRYELDSGFMAREYRKPGYARVFNGDLKRQNVSQFFDNLRPHANYSDYVRQMTDAKVVSESQGYNKSLQEMGVPFTGKLKPSYQMPDMSENPYVFKGRAGSEFQDESLGSRWVSHLPPSEYGLHGHRYRQTYDSRIYNNIQTKENARSFRTLFRACLSETMV